MENIYQQTQFILQKYGIHANKKLGQNFLVSDEAVEKIVEAAKLEKKDLVIEIGPGLGNLTQQLLEKAGKVICIELDDRMLKILEDRFKLYENFELLHNDIMKIDLKELIQKEEYKSVKVVANLPYYITTPIIMKLLEEHLPIESITIMVQKEVAKRIVAKPGSHLSGAITYSVYYYCEPKEILEVAKDSFIPAPEVDSEVIQLVLREKPPIELIEEKMFFQVIKASFSQRRKTFINGMINNKIATKEEISNILQKMQINEKIRGENLSIEQFAQISNLLVAEKMKGK